MCLHVYVCECVCFPSVDLYEFEMAGAHPCIDLLKLAGPQYLFTRFLLTSRRYSIMEMGWACDWGNAKLVLWRCEGGMHWGDRYRGGSLFSYQADWGICWKADNGKKNSNTLSLSGSDWRYFVCASVFSAWAIRVSAILLFCYGEI